MVEFNQFIVLSFENGVQVSRTFVSSETMVSQPEIVMIGVQSPYSVQTINGLLAYISSGNAWVMENNTGNRRRCNFRRS